MLLLLVCKSLMVSDLHVSKGLSEGQSVFDKMHYCEKSLL